jgi:hypothetical protein
MSAQANHDEKTRQFQHQSKVLPKSFCRNAVILSSADHDCCGQPRMEDDMLKYLLISGALIAFGAQASRAQQQEAHLQRLEVSAAGFDIILVTAKQNSPQVDYRGEPHPHLIYLAEGELVHAYDSNMQRLFPDLSSVLRPSCITRDGRIPVAIYIVPKDSETTALQK